MSWLITEVETVAKQKPPPAKPATKQPAKKRARAARGGGDQSKPKRQCKCGATDHLTANSKKCPLNRAHKQ
jgi:hypothetical protein